MTEPHPIRQRIRGIDLDYRFLTPEEVSQLTQPGPSPSRGDWFAQWLATTPVEQRQLSLRSFLDQALDPNNSFYQSFAVADGTAIVYDHENEDNPLNSVSRHLRFVTIILPDTRGAPSALTQHAIVQRTLCLVSSSDPDGVDGRAFLQCASWDPHAFGRNRGLMRFYERERNRPEGNTGWVLVGDSFHAFNSQASNHGPFDGHIGGVMIMKELRRPWLHWYDVGNLNEFQRSLGSTRAAGTKVDPKNALHDPLFSGQSRTPFSLLGRAETLEIVVTNSISTWYLSRFRRDFWVPGSTQGLPEITTPIRQWVMHILANRSMNIASSATSTAQVEMEQDLQSVPITLFYNQKAFQWVLPNAGGETESIVVSNALYRAAISKLGISIYYDAPVGASGDSGSSRRQVAVQNTEGPFPFAVIEPGIEDYAGVRILLRNRPSLLPAKAVAAMLMVDFWNPMYSARRESLMKYVPERATFDPDTRSYNVLQQFIENVKKSPESVDPKSVEHEILQLLATPDDEYEAQFTSRINAYIARVRQRVNDTDKEKAGAAVEEYMTLAEGRRRTYRRRESQVPNGSGLDEFLLTLPIAARPDPFPITEMTEAGEVRVKEEMSKFGAVAAHCPAMRSEA
ncbi:unnamed protein product [Rhizoctonia solani]|uniref:Uncharacterized protein n=1 Tax=Rhizoctonia solani TaxID=456999 RepID=A0A8H3CCX7_9AGAM|nr:unnamed protein product [Rhizoctonia solani]